MANTDNKSEQDARKKVKPSWKIKGRKYIFPNPDQEQTFDKESKRNKVCYIPIYDEREGEIDPEDDDCIDTNEEIKKLPEYGIPVDANLAIHMMADFICRLKKETEIDLRNKFYDTDCNKSVEQITQLEKLKCWIYDLLITSFGMTFNKNVILKILSQPGCEHLRMYLCTKSIGPEDEINSNKKESNTKDYLSLVLVGVDKHLCDLRYKDDDLICETDDKKRSYLTVNTMSLSAEYGHPPNKQENFVPDERWTFFKWAQKIVEGMEKAKLCEKEKHENQPHQNERSNQS